MSYHGGTAVQKGQMTTSEGDRGVGLRDRMFAWYWERRARQAKDLSSFRSLLLRRRSELDRIARRTETALARGGARAPTPSAAIWTHHLDVFDEPQSPSTLVDPPSGSHPSRGLSIYHDAARGGFTLAQRPSRAKAAGRRFELFYESYDFAGAYLSLAVAIPDDLRRPQVGEVLRVFVDLSASRLIKTFVRLNLASPNRNDVLHADGELGHGGRVFDFDLAFAAFEPQEGDKIWLDLIIDRPRMVEFALRDLEVRLIPRGET